jgi:hypothetical protein
MASRHLHLRAAVVVAPLILCIGIDCLAQEPVQDHSCTVDAAGIFAIPAGKDRDNFNHGGWGIQAGGGFAVTHSAEPNHGHAWYITANYLFNKFRVRESALVATIAKEPQFADAKSAHGDFSAVTLDPTFRLTLNRHSSFYWLGGFGWLHRGIGFSGLSAVPPLLPSSSSLGSAVSNFGMGFNFAPTSFRGVMLFTEARVYHGTAINSGSTLVPISVGVRW